LESLYIDISNKKWIFLHVFSSKQGSKIVEATSKYGKTTFLWYTV
jgi:hypothetical protein